ncbi:hypothetical protein [Pseudogulbenkiania sp. MAI-1]|uniref:hypothetical protein n=1 Tax=Pseudogulbenkiania sp. MAI-1 TaxID=990370 RepID=UPI0012EC4270|nr:hypothetical protein [Pseudogulbenkiania sp. MAI-1]
MSKLNTPLIRSLMLCTGLALGASPAIAGKVTTNIDWPATLSLDFSGSCSNSPGPWITLGPGVLTLHDVPVTVRFDGGGEHDEDVVKNVDFSLEIKDAIKLPKQGSQPDGVTGNPYVSILLNGKTIFGPVRCNKL